MRKQEKISMCVQYASISNCVVGGIPPHDDYTVVVVVISSSYHTDNIKKVFFFLIVFTHEKRWLVWWCLCRFACSLVSCVCAFRVDI